MSSSQTACSCTELATLLRDRHAGLKTSLGRFARRYDCVFDAESDRPKGWKAAVKGVRNLVLEQLLAMADALEAATSVASFYNDARVYSMGNDEATFPQFGWKSASAPQLHISLRPVYNVPAGRLRVSLGNTRLLGMVANTHRLPAEKAERAHLAGAAGTCDLEMGQYPLTLAISKGWNHVFKGAKQASYIRWLLSQPKELVDVNQHEWRFGMTPLHIACARGDPPQLIQRLLNAGASASLAIRDKRGRTPIDCLETSFEEAQRLLIRMACYNDSIRFGTSAHERINVISVDSEEYDERRNPVYLENECNVGTLPTRASRAQNQVQIRAQLVDASLR